MTVADLEKAFDKRLVDALASHYAKLHDALSDSWSDVDERLAVDSTAGTNNILTVPPQTENAFRVDFVLGYVAVPPDPVSSAYGTATTPTAGQSIVNLALPAGTYNVIVNPWYGATPDTTADNMKLVIAGVSTISQLEVPLTANGPSIPQQFQVVLAVAGNLQVQAIANASAGAIYKARLDVSPALPAQAGLLQLGNNHRIVVPGNQVFNFSCKIRLTNTEARQLSQVTYANGIPGTPGSGTGGFAYLHLGGKEIPPGAIRW